MLSSPRSDCRSMRLASWIRFETAMTSEDWEGAISLLVSNLHCPDQELLALLQSCVAGQPIASMIYLTVDNRMPADVPHWPAFAAWWASRRCLVGPQEEATDILWVCADATTGLHKVPYCWAGVFVLEAARFLCPAQHFALIDNDCVPVTLFEAQDPLQLAHQQHQWVDLMGCARSESAPVQVLACYSSQRLTWNIMQVWSFRSAIAASTVHWSMTRLPRRWRRTSRQVALP